MHAAGRGDEQVVRMLLAVADIDVALKDSVSRFVRSYKPSQCFVSNITNENFFYC
jgi:hypothetical protein